MQRLEVSVAVRPIYGSLGVKWLRNAESDTDDKVKKWISLSCVAKKYHCYWLSKK